MASRINFTEDEYTLCTYAAMYGADDLGGITALNLENHPPSSIVMKIMNIVADLDEEDISRSGNWAPLNGTAAGMGARRTGWQIVRPLTELPRPAFLERCQRILSRK
jgi:hypothetical protein